MSNGKVGLGTVFYLPVIIVFTKSQYSIIRGQRVISAELATLDCIRIYAAANESALCSAFLA